MIFATPDKVCNRIDKLIAKLETAEGRIAHHEQEFEVAQRLGLAGPDDGEDIKLWRRVHTQLIENLPRVRDLIRRGEEDFRQVNRALKHTDRQVFALELDIQAADRAEEIGRQAARDRFGGMS
ncbi:MAG: hypothetical protein AAF559_04745 [Pseudomonadota bacterium]